MNRNSKTARQFGTVFKTSNVGVAYPTSQGANAHAYVNANLALMNEERVNPPYIPAESEGNPVPSIPGLPDVGAGVAHDKVAKAWSPEARAAALAARHSQYGKFVARPPTGNNRREYVSPDGTMVLHDWNYQGGGGRIAVSEVGSKDYGMLTQSNNSGKIRQFLQHRYGIEAI